MYGLTRAKAQSYIKSGSVLVDGKVCCKPSFLVDENCIELVSKERYVSRGAYKLLGAIEDFKLGKPIIVADDEDRENEGDLICSAQFVTPELVNFITKE